MSTQIYKVKAPDGSIINVKGPANAKPEEVIAQAQRLFKTQSVAKAPTAPQPQSETRSSVPATNIGPEQSNVGRYIAHSLEALSQYAGEGTGLQDSLRWLANKIPVTKKEANDTVRNIGSTAAGATVMAFAPESAPFLGPLLASGAIAGFDQAARASTGEGTGSMFTDNPYLATLTGTAENEIGGRVLGGITKGAIEAVKPGSIAVKGLTPELENLKPTYGQVTGHDLVENLFAKGKKEASVNQSVQIANARVKEIVSALTQRSNATNPHLAEAMQGEVKGAFKNSVQASNAEAENFLQAASTNVHSIPQPPTIQQKPDIYGVMRPVSVPTPPKLIEGPTPLNDLLTTAKKITDEMALSKVPVDPESPLLTAVKGLFDNTEAKFDASGKLISHEPVSAAEAWKTKQVLDAHAYGDPMQNITATDAKFKELSKAANRDIDNAIPTWQNNAQQAMDSWKTAKAIVNQRHEVFSPLFETGAGTKTLLNTVNAPDSAVDAILQDRMKVERFLQTGNLKVNGRTISATNAKRDLQGYAINDIWNKGWTPTDPLNHAAGIANGEQMATHWIELANSDVGKKLFNSREIANYNGFFDAVRKVSKQPSLSTRWITLNFGTRAASLGSAILAGQVAGGSIGSAGVLGGAIGLSGVARIMTSKRWAPVFLAMIHGRPLGMSFQAASRGLVQALSGSGISLENADGSTTEAMVGTDGLIRPVGQK